MADIKDQLVRLGAEHPDLRNDIRPILKALETTSERVSAASLSAMWKDARSKFLEDVRPILEGRNTLGRVGLDITNAKVVADTLQFMVYSPGEEFGPEDKYTLWLPQSVFSGGKYPIALNSTRGTAVSESTKFRLDTMTPKHVADWANSVLHDFYVG